MMYYMGRRKIELCRSSSDRIDYDSWIIGIFYLYPWKMLFMVGFVGRHSVPSGVLKACNTTSYYYTDHNVLPDLNQLLGRSDTHENLLSPLCKVAIKVCLLYYCRIQELLNVTVSDLVNPDRALLKGLKGSSDYIIYLPGLTKQISAWENKRNNTKLFPVSYVNLYRSMLRAVPGSPKIKQRNTKRLHQSRYQIVADLIGRTSEANVSAILRHRSGFSLSYYIK